MKILHVVNSLGTGGAEKLVAELVPLQQKFGHFVDVVILRGGVTPCRKLLERETCGNVFDFGAGTSVYSPLNIFRLIPFIRKYDVVHVHLFPAQYWVVVAKILSFSGARLVTTEHSVNNRRRGSALWRIADRLVYSQYVAIVCCAEAAKTALCRHVGMWRRICTIANGVDIAKIARAKAASRKDLGIPEPAFVLCQVARFIWPKDQDTVIRALPILRKNIHAVFIGDGERRKVCEELAVKLNVRERVHFLGVRENIPELTKMADVIVCSSEYEGLSLASVEGMAAGKPVVASDVPGLAEVVGGAGILFPQGDESALAGTIVRLATDKDFSAHTAAACFRRAQNFDIRKTAAEYLKIYDEVCADFAERKEIKP